MSPTPETLDDSGPLTLNPGQALEKLTEEKRALILRTSQLVATLEASETQVYC